MPVLGASWCQPRKHASNSNRCRQPGKRHPAQTCPSHVLHIFYILQPRLPRTHQGPLLCLLLSADASPRRHEGGTPYTANSIEVRLDAMYSVGVGMSPSCYTPA